MKLGFFTMPIHPLAKDWRQSLREDREAFLLADELGFTEAYVGEHVTDRAENITSCIAFIAWIAAATCSVTAMPRARPGTAACFASPATTMAPNPPPCRISPTMPSSRR